MTVCFLKIYFAGSVSLEHFFKDWKLDKKNYRLQFQIEVTLTKLSTLFNNLGIADRNLFDETHNSMNKIGKETVKKRYGQKVWL